MVLLYMTQRPGEDTEGVPGSTSTRGEPVNSRQHEPLSMASLFFLQLINIPAIPAGPPPSLREESRWV